MSTPSKVILVTGGNRGIGLAIIQSLATHPQTQHATIFMGCRDVTNGVNAISELKDASPNLDTSRLHPLELDVTSNTSISNAISKIQSSHNHLDVLINNAGYAIIPKAEDYSDVRSSFSDTFEVNVMSVYMMTILSLPLLKNSPSKNAKVINISSGRGSLTRSLSGQSPPTAAITYNVSKTALNALTIELSKLKDSQDIEFQLACPGHCKTRFNGFRGKRDPVEGADVVVELVVGPRRDLGSWETVGADRVLREVPW